MSEILLTTEKGTNYLVDTDAQTISLGAICINYHNNEPFFIGMNPHFYDENNKRLKLDSDIASVQVSSGKTMARQNVYEETSDSRMPTIRDYEGIVCKQAMLIEELKQQVSHLERENQALKEMQKRTTEAINEKSRRGYSFQL